MGNDRAYDVVDVAEESRYEARTTDGETVGVLEYRREGDRLVLPSTRVPPQHEGKGIAGALTRQVLDDAREGGLTVVPHCWYVEGWIDRHPEYADLVAR